MSIYSTSYITRKEAEELVRKVRAVKRNELSSLSDIELDEELDEYVHTQNYTDILGVARNYIIRD